MELIRALTAEQYAQALEAWQWMDLEGKEPVFASLFGDLFFVAVDGIWWLDVLEGTLTRPWGSIDEFRAATSTPEGRDTYLLAGLAFAAAERDVVPGPDQMYDFPVPPVLGGPMDAASLQVVDVVVGLNVAGQVHRQIRHLPPGTPVDGIAVDDGRT
ncbi:MAG TPA: hypothetical protein VIB11_13345 [Pedococcus sp.]|jgi:hypothetical protein|uniref:hypothetical protein n=1 Tax=Pedococcus sp. TaxID=2860345 RepID=UPI002F95C7AA